MSIHRVAIDINGQTYEADVEPRMLLCDFIRQHARLTGTRVGCEHGVCGSCTVQLDCRPIRSCLMFAIQARGREVRTVEALEATEPGTLHPLQQAFHKAHALQCGFCTPGLLMTLDSLLAESHGPMTDEQIREAIAGNICRCTGYQNIVDAVRSFSAADVTWPPFSGLHLSGQRIRPIP